MLASIGHEVDIDVGILLDGVSAGETYIDSGKGPICLHHSLSNSNEGITDGHLGSPIDCVSGKKSSGEPCECTMLTLSISLRSTFTTWSTSKACRVDVEFSRLLGWASEFSYNWRSSDAVLRTIRLAEISGNFSHKYDPPIRDLSTLT